METQIGLLKLKIKILCLFLAFYSAYSMPVLGQCDTQFFANLALQEKIDGFNLITSFAVDRKGHRMKEYTCVFTEGYTYLINIKSKDGGANGIVANLWNAKRELLLKSYNPQTQKYAEAMLFKCPKTGIYYLNFNFQEGSYSYCGGAVLSRCASPKKEKKIYKPIHPDSIACKDRLYYYDKNGVIRPID